MPLGRALGQNPRGRAFGPRGGVAAPRPPPRARGAAGSMAEAPGAREAPLLDSPPRPQILAALVARGPEVVLAEHSAQGNGAQQATLQIMHKIDAAAEWKSYIYGNFAFHCLLEGADRLWFVCMADKAMGRRLPFALLASMQETFNQWYTQNQVAEAVAHGMQSEFQGEIRILIDKYNSPNADRVGAMMQRVQHINDNLIDGFDKILERQEKIDLLVNRCQNLSDSSNSFRREAERVRRVVWWKNTRCLLLLGLVVVVVVLIVLMSSCGIKFDECG